MTIGPVNLIEVLIALSVALGVFALLVVVRRAFINRWGRFAESTANTLDDDLVTVLRRTQWWFLLVVGLSAATFYLDLPSQADHFFQSVTVLALLLQAGLWSSTFSPRIARATPNQHLAGLAGILHADGFAGFNNLYRTGRIHEAACRADVRRKFHDIWKANNSAQAKEAIDRIGALYAIEAESRGELPEVRQRERRARAGPLLDELKIWLDELRTQVSAKSDIARAIAYARNRWDALTRYRDLGEVEIDNNAAEWAIRRVALRRKNYLFAGSDAGGESAAMIYSLIGTAKLNGLDPFRYLHAVIERINDHRVNAVDQILPCNIDLADGQAD